MSLTLNPAALTRSLRHAGHSIANSETVAPGAVRVQPMLGAAGREAKIKALAAELLQRGYDAAINASRTAVTVTLPAEELAEPEVMANGVILIDPRTPLSPEHLADAAREVEVITAETDADVEGRIYPALGGDGFTAAPSHSCPLCPSVGSTLCNLAGESLTFPTREAAAEALAHHAEHGCPDVSDADDTTGEGWRDGDPTDAPREVGPGECPACGATIAVTRDENGVITECGGEGEGTCDEAILGTERTIAAHDAAVLADAVERVRVEYLACAAHNRQDDLAAFVAEATDDPAGIAYEWCDTANDLGMPLGDPHEGDKLAEALFSAAQTWVKQLTVEQLEVAFYASTLPVGTRVRHTTGSLGTVVGAVELVTVGQLGDDVMVTVAFDGDETERRHPSTVTPVE